MKYVSSCFFIRTRGNRKIDASFAEYGQILPVLLPAAPYLLPNILPYYPPHPVIQCLLVSGEGCQSGKCQHCVRCKLT